MGLVEALDYYNQLKNLCKTLNVSPPSLDEIASVDARYKDENLYISSDLESLKKADLEKLLDLTEKVRDRIVWRSSAYEDIKRNLRIIDPVRYKEFVEKYLGQLEKTKKEIKQKLHVMKSEISSSASEIKQKRNEYNTLEEACEAAQNKIDSYIDRWVTIFEANDMPIDDELFDNIPTMTPEQFKKEILDMLEKNLIIENDIRQKSRRRTITKANIKTILNLAKQIYNNLNIYDEKNQEKENILAGVMEKLKNEIKKCENQKQQDEKTINDLMLQKYQFKWLNYVMENDDEILHQYDETDMQLLINGFLESVNEYIVKDSDFLEKRDILCNALISLWFCIQRIDKIKQTFNKYFPEYDL